MPSRLLAVLPYLLSGQALLCYPDSPANCRATVQYLLLTVQPSPARCSVSLYAFRSDFPASIFVSPAHCSAAVCPLLLTIRSLFMDRLFYAILPHLLAVQTFLLAVLSHLLTAQLLSCLFCLLYSLYCSLSFLPLFFLYRLFCWLSCLTCSLLSCCLVSAAPCPASPSRFFASFAFCAAFLHSSS